MAEGAPRLMLLQDWGPGVRCPGVWGRLGGGDLTDRLLWGRPGGRGPHTVDNTDRVEHSGRECFVVVVCSTAAGTAVVSGLAEEGWAGEVRARKQG